MDNVIITHNPTPETSATRFEQYTTEDVLITKLVQAPQNVMPAFVHEHDEYEFLIPHTPIPNLINGKSAYFGEVGWVYPVRPGCEHGLKFNLSNISGTTIIVGRQYLEDIIEKENKKDMLFAFQFRITDEIRFYLENFKTEYKRIDQSKYKQNLMAALLCVALVDAGMNKQDSSNKISFYNRGIKGITEYINEHYILEIQLEELARMSGFSKSYFIKVFKLATGESPVTYINKLRISQAKYLIETTDLPVTQIAKLCGFRKQNSFTSQFKRYSEVTPKEYRNHTKKILK